MNDCNKSNDFALNSKIRINNNNNNYYSKFKFYKRKRNYHSLINENNNRNEMSKIDNNVNNNSSKDKMINNNNNHNKTEEEILFDVEALSQELLKCKNEEELKEALFLQLLLLEQKKRKFMNLDELKRRTNMLEKDKYDLLKCQKAVTRALNKKIDISNNLNNIINEFVGEISQMKGRIEYYQSLGDLYIKELNKLKKV